MDPISTFFLGRVAGGICRSYDLTDGYGGLVDEYCADARRDIDVLFVPGKAIVAYPIDEVGSDRFDLGGAPVADQQRKLVSTEARQRILLCNPARQRRGQLL